MVECAGTVVVVGVDSTGAATLVTVSTAATPTDARPLLTAVVRAAGVAIDSFWVAAAGSTLGVPAGTTMV